MVRFTRLPENRSMIDRAAARAVSLDKELVLADVQMDLSATHANGCRLDFKCLLEFQIFDFLHDIYGIRNCLDRTTGQLTNGFRPRCAARRAVGKAAA